MILTQALGHSSSAGRQQQLSSLGESLIPRLPDSSRLRSALLLPHKLLVLAEEFPHNWISGGFCFFLLRSK